MEIRRVFLSILLIISCLSKTEARLGTPMLFEVSQGIKEEYWYANPAIGSILIDSGFMDGLRFWGNWRLAYKVDNSDERDYSKDEGQDALMAILKHLFPSPAGALGGANSDQYFCNYITPENVAQLVNYLNAGRDINHWVEGQDSDGKPLFNRNAKTKCVRKFAEHVKAARVSGYPNHMLEQFLMACFIEKTNTTEDLQRYWKNLDPETKVPGFHLNGRILNKEDVGIEVERVSELNLIASIVALKSLNDLYSVSPYAMDAELFSNGRANHYNRETNTLKGPYFADCMETMLRETYNFLLYKNTSGFFEVNELKGKYEANKKKVLGKNNFTNFCEFFEIYQRDRISANNSSSEMRGWWNRVVGNLDGGVVYAHPDGNELDTGFLNMLRAMRRILDMPTDDLTPEAFGLEMREISQIEEMLLKKLQEMFDLIKTSEKSVKLAFENLKKDHKDLYGELEVNVNLIGEQTSFSFKICISKRHGEVNNFQQKNTQGMPDVTVISANVEQKIQASEDQLKQVASLSSNKLKKHLVQDPHNVYWLYQCLINDNASMALFLERISKLDDNIIGRDNIIIALINSIKWDDDEVDGDHGEIYQYVIEKFSYIKKYLEVYRHHGKDEKQLDFTEFPNVKIVYLNGTIEQIKGLENAKNLEELYCEGLQTQDWILDLTGLTKLKKLRLEKIILKGIKGNASNLEELEGIDLQMPNGTLNLGGLKNLKRINLFNSIIGKIENLGDCINLEELGSHGLQMPNGTLDLGGLKNLKILKLSGAIIGKVKNLGNGTNLEEFHCSSMEMLNGALDVTSIANLKILKLSGAVITEIKDLGNFVNLEALHYYDLQMPDGTLNLPNIRNLKNLSLFGAIIGKIENLGNFTNLEELDCSKLKMLNGTLDLTGLGKLRYLKLEGTTIKEIKDLENASNLEKISCSFMKMPNGILDLTGQTALKNIDLSWASVKDIKNLGNCTSLEMLDCRALKMPNGTLDVTSLANLKSLNLRNAKVKEIKGLETLPRGILIKR